MDFSQLGHSAVIGLQWGDEGKGKIVDLLTEHFDVVVRYAGGANAGHTVRIGAESYALHLLPSGILRKSALNLIAPGVVVDLEILAGEIDGLRKRNIHVGDNLRISERAHLVMPWHKMQDKLAESSAGDARKIGTTAKGIGPCYADKMLRSTAIRVGDLHDADRFRERVAAIAEIKNKIFAALYADATPINAGEVTDEYLALADRLKSHFADTTRLLHERIDAGDRVLFEGAQGSMLDINHGTYPYVTSSACIAGGVNVGAGVAPSLLQSVVGVVKAYSTRVGGGPFPTEQDNDIGDRIRDRGHEYGTTTGRPRRCGWFDAVAARHAIRLSGVTELCVMHLDTLGTFDEVRICTAYRNGDETSDAFPSRAEVLADVAPVFESLPGWKVDRPQVDSFEQLPAEARSYIERLETILGVPITLVSIGPERTATLHRAAGVGASV
ncbi:MAG TPA: adenylosuccinate synthase [Phycisphaerae bacterium]|nr:adenylosuccinate synthase [Phycisphaerae bacterium]HRW51994.1 adenylosuccinate synthase [Phycisphaerae bacterium]